MMETTPDRNISTVYLGGALDGIRKQREALRVKTAAAVGAALMWCGLR